MDCIFCKIANKEIPSKVLYEDDLVIVIMDINPSVDGHAMIIPKKHYTDYLELDEILISHIFKVAKELGPKTMKAMNAKGLTMMINYGEAQEVKHFHFHLLPDYGSNPKRSIEENFEILKKSVS